MSSLGLILRLAAVGAIAGGLLRIREILEQNYLAQHLSRTALWTLSEGASMGAAAGLAASLALAGLLGFWWVVLGAGRKPKGHPAGPEPNSARAPRRALLRFTFFGGLVATGAVLASPQGGGPPGGPPYLSVMLGALGAVWLPLSALAAWTAGTSAAQASEGRWFRARWATIAALALAAAWLHVWVRARSWPELESLTLAVIVASAVIFLALRAPARYLHDRAGRALGNLAAGRVGFGLSCLALALVVGLALSGRVVRDRAPAGRSSLNVILIGIDTLRWDRCSLLSPGDHARDLTPNLRRVATRGVVFSDAITQAPWTLPAFASILTGLYPEQHGAQFLTATLPASQLTATEMLREAGYQTMGCVSHAYLSRASGLGQGFEVLDETQVTEGRGITSAAVTDRGVGLLAKRGRRPFFLFLHYFDPHFCYEDHAQFDYSDGYRGWLREPVEKADQNAFRWMTFALGPAFEARSKLSHEDRTFLSDAYDEEVAYTDAQIGRLFDYLEAEDLWDSTVVIVVGDHGEELAERNWSGHTVTLYQELIHVPLVVAAPRTPSRVERGAVETRAIFDTVVDMAGLPVRNRPLAAGSLLSPAHPANPLVRSSSHPIEEAPGPGEFIPKYVWLTSVIDGRWKLIEDRLRRRFQLIDMVADPGELHDLSGDRPDVRARLERELEGINADIARKSRVADVPEASQEQKRKLRSLGYL